VTLSQQNNYNFLSSYLFDYFNTLTPCKMSDGSEIGFELVEVGLQHI